MARKTVMPVPYHKRLIAALLDGKPHTFRNLYQRVARFIDPAVADKQYRRRHPKWKDDREAERVAQGRKRLLFLSLNSLHHHAKTVEVVGDGRDWDRQYRLTRDALKKLAASTKGQTRKAKSARTAAAVKRPAKPASTPKAAPPAAEEGRAEA